MIRLDEYLEIMTKLLDFGDISEYEQKYGRQVLYEKLAEAESFYMFSEKTKEYTRDIHETEIIKQSQENNRKLLIEGIKGST